MVSSGNMSRPCYHKFKEYEGSRQKFSQFKCEQVLIGETKVEKGKNVDRVNAKQQRCVYCIRSKKNRRKNPEDTASSDSGTPRRARRTAYTCLCHRDAFCCKKGVGGCWEHHLKEYGTTANTQHSEVKMMTTMGPTLIEARRYGWNSVGA
jgi:hypothetical protein